jgi:acyl carrier protein
MVSLLLHVETKLKIRIDSHELANVVKVGDLLDLVEEKLAAPAIQQAA